MQSGKEKIMAEKKVISLLKSSRNEYVNIQKNEPNPVNRITRKKSLTNIKKKLDTKSQGQYTI